MSERNEFKKLSEYLVRLELSYFNILDAFYVFDALKKLKAPNIVGEREAKENLDIENNFLHFFPIIEESLRTFIFLELAKIFDSSRSSRKSLHLNKLINFARSNLKNLTRERFLKNFQRKNSVDRLLLETYREMNQKDIEKMLLRLDDNKKTLKNLKKYRDQQIAHNDLNPKEIKISVEEIEGLLEIIEEVLNLFSNKISFSHTIYDRIKDDCKNDVERIFNILRKKEEWE